MDQRRVPEGTPAVQRGEIHHAVPQRDADAACAAAVLLALVSDQPEQGQD